MKRIGKLLTAALVVCLASISCKGKKETDGASKSTASAAHIGLAECSACKMVVREQSAPRGQVVHRDGTRAHFCSLGDLVHYLEAPSPHGRATGIFVEALESTFDPTITDTKERPWVAADSATYVVGVKRKRIMGPAVLSYRQRSQGESAAKKHDGKLTTWPELPKFVLKAK